MHTFNVYIMCLQDIRLDRGRGAYIERITKNTLGGGSTVISVPAAPFSQQRGVSSQAFRACRRTYDHHWPRMESPQHIQLDRLRRLWTYCRSRVKYNQFQIPPGCWSYPYIGPSHEQTTTAQPLYGTGQRVWCVSTTTAATLYPFFKSRVHLPSMPNVWVPR